MRILDLQGRERNVSWNKHRINWDRKVSGPQMAVKRFLRPYWEGHAVYEEVQIPGSRLRVDLINLHIRTVIEVSPAGSHSYNPFFHRGSRLNFTAALKRDLKKQEWAERNDFRYIELTDDDLNNLSTEWLRTHHQLDL